MQKKKFRIPRKKIAEFSKKWSITEFSLFGSVLRDDFRPDSDVEELLAKKLPAGLHRGEYDFGWGVGGTLRSLT